MTPAVETPAAVAVDDHAPAAAGTGPSRVRLVAIYLAVCAIWGTTWYAMKTGVESVPPMTAAGLRFVLAFPFLAVLVWLSPTASFRFPRGRRWLLPFVAIGYIAVPYTLINYGEQSISSGLASLLFASVTVFLLVFTRLVSGTRVSPRQWAGIAAGLACLVVVVLDTTGGISADGLLAPGAVLLAAVMHALTYAVLARHANDVSVLTVEVLPLGAGGLLVLLAGLATERPDLGAVSTASWLAILYLAVVASVVGFAAYFFLLKHLPAVTLSFVFVFFPVIAVVVSATVEHSALGPVALVAAAAMLGSFALTKTGGERA